MRQYEVSEPMTECRSLSLASRDPGSDVLVSGAAHARRVEPSRGRPLGDQPAKTEMVPLLLHLDHPTVRLTVNCPPSEDVNGICEPVGFKAGPPHFGTVD
jgi:hypothetical protein